MKKPRIVPRSVLRQLIWQQRIHFHFSGIRGCDNRPTLLDRFCGAPRETILIAYAQNHSSLLIAAVFDKSISGGGGKIGSVLVVGQSCCRGDMRMTHRPPLDAKGGFFCACRNGHIIHLRSYVDTPHNITLDGL